MFIFYFLLVFNVWLDSVVIENHDTTLLSTTRSNVDIKGYNSDETRLINNTEGKIRENFDIKKKEFFTGGQKSDRSGLEK